MLYGFTRSAVFPGACFPLSALYRHFDEFTARNLSAPFQPSHALNECDGVRQLATMEREPHHTPHHHRNENATTEPPRNQERANTSNKTQTRTANTERKTSPKKHNVIF